jgi:DNA-binding NarL/FixJ family response regulator
MLTSYSNDQAIIGSFIAGASGYLLKELRSQEVIAAVRKVGRGQSLLDPAITLRVLERVRNGTQTDEWSRLTSLEQQILELIATGKTDNEIAALVSLNVSTVKDHINSILAKLEVTRRYQATTYIAEWRMQRTSRYPQSGNSGR